MGVIEFEAHIARIEKVLEKYRNPALMLSFGKDSMVLLWLLRHLGLPVICHMTPWQPEKWEFAHQMIRANKLAVYDFPPTTMGLQEKDGALELVAGYAMGGDRVIGIRQEIIEAPATGVCGLNDCLRRPRGGIAHEWDLLVCGQKNNDPDHFGGKHKIASDIKQSIGGAADVYFPLRLWSDAEVWGFIHKHQIPYDKERYSNHNRSRNPDSVEGCFACVRKDTGATVICPRLGGVEINNVSDHIEYLKHDTSI